jgi:hypothetical protein
MRIIPIMIHGVTKSDEVLTTDTCIAGAGPHGLAAALHLKQVNPSADITVIDHSDQWLATWNQQFKYSEITTLRSPIVHHPSPHPYALTDFVKNRELSRSGLPYDPPTTEAFAAFCAEIIAESTLAPPIAATLESLRSNHQGLELETSSGTLRAQNLIIATNPHQRLIPQWTWSLIGRQPGLVEHALDVNLPDLPDLSGQNISIIGGGLTAAHLARNAAIKGATVKMIARRPLQIRDFDTEPGWLGPKYLTKYLAESDENRRIQAAREARGGGSIPGWMRDHLEEPTGEGRIEILESTEVVSAQVSSPRGCILELNNGETAYSDRVWLATGTQSSLQSMRCLHSVLDDIPVIDGFPLVDQSLRLGPHPIFVMGRSATFALGPAAGNLWGARHAAHRITAAITGIELAPDGYGKSFREHDSA